MKDLKAKDIYKISIIKDHDDPIIPYIVRTEFAGNVKAYKIKRERLISVFDESIRVLKEESILEAKQASEVKDKIISLLDDCYENNNNAYRPG